MLKVRYCFVFVFIYWITQIQASINCPSNKTLSCFDNAYNLNITGKATATGYSAALVKYVDTKTFNQCSIGNIDRTWYLDINNDNNFQSNEVNCTQKITIVSNGSPIEIFFPKDTTYSCKDNIVKDRPTWISGPCDVLGYNVSESTFEVNGSSCYKILRKFTVINWCNYGGNPVGQGIWTHSQFIKVEEKNPPTITDCTNKVIELESDCKTSFKISNSAFDDNNCSSPLLSWIVEIDLWGNGTFDYKYGFTESGDFMINPVSNGKEISLTLPVRVGAGKHKVKWSVRDQCGNFTSCQIIVETKDTKNPTPYIHDFITSSFQGNIMGLMVPARIFDAGSYDNCTPQKSIKISFSPDVNDTIRIVDCTNAGFQFFTLHITDQAGNFETIDAFMLVFDNGTCFGGRSLNGKITEPDGSPLKDVKMMLKRPNQPEISTSSGIDGIFKWNNISIYDDYIISGAYSQTSDGRVDIADLKILQDYIFGIKKLENFQWVAADVDGDRKIKIKDLELIKSKILTPNDIEPWSFVFGSDTIKSISDLAKIKNNLKIKEIDGKISLKAIYAGDISDANKKISNIRSKIYLYKKVHNNKVDFYLKSPMAIAGLQINISLPLGMEQINLYSDYFEIENGNLITDYSKGNMKFLVLKDFVGTQKEPLFSFYSSSNTDVSKIFIGNNSKILLPDYSTAILETSIQKPSDTDINVQINPNPSNGNFYLNDPSAQIIDVIDLSGKKIQFHQIDNSFEIISIPGVYFVRLTTDGLIQCHKVLKI